MSLSNSQSFFEPPPSDSGDEVNSLPSSTTGSSVDDDEYVSDAEREWRESLQQIELLLTMVLVPYVGKYFGRKAAYWGECTTGNERSTKSGPDSSASPGGLKEKWTERDG
ncbi:hypothetical protein PSPO01_09018 [Paraphaeosphaeria sporulosa]